MYTHTDSRRWTGKPNLLRRDLFVYGNICAKSRDILPEKKKKKQRKKRKNKIIIIIAAELLHLLVDFPQTDKRSLSHSYIISIVFYLYSFKLIGFT
jgi:hypothetical protein